MTLRRIWALLLVCLAVGATDASANPVALNSGKSVEILSVGPMVGPTWSALLLKYQTALPINDVPSLRMEADELWQRFVVDVEHGGYSSAIISASTPPSGMIIQHSQQYNFVFEKKNGAWRSPEANQRTKLDKDFVTSFMGRLDSADRNHEINALLLYIADDFAMRVSSKAPGMSGPPSINRSQFAADEVASWQATKNYYDQRKILGISISRAQTSATVESRDTNQANLGAHHVITVAHYEDVVELRGRYMLWTKSEMTIEKQTVTSSN